jgi:hypothetical protein
VQKIETQPLSHLYKNQLKGGKKTPTQLNIRHETLKLRVGIIGEILQDIGKSSDFSGLDPKSTENNSKN